MLVIAHRGASGYAPENTAAAFDLAIEMGATMIETDVQVTRDGALVLIHDALVDRTTNGHGPVADYLLAELQALDAGSWFGPDSAEQRILILEDALGTWLPRVPICLEVKDPLAVMPFIAAMRDGVALERVQVTSFSWSAVLAVRANLPVVCGFLSQTFDDDIIERCVARGIDQICPPAELLTTGQVERAHQAGLAVRAWGVRTREDVDRVFATGADGATVNWPDWMTEHSSYGKDHQS